MTFLMVMTTFAHVELLLRMPRILHTKKSCSKRGSRGGALARTSRHICAALFKNTHYFGFIYRFPLIVFFPPSLTALCTNKMHISSLTGKTCKISSYFLFQFIMSMPKSIVTAFCLLFGCQNNIIGFYNSYLILLSTIWSLKTWQ